MAGILPAGSARRDNQASLVLVCVVDFRTDLLTDWVAVTKAFRHKGVLQWDSASLPPPLQPETVTAFVRVNSADHPCTGSRGVC